MLPGFLGGQGHNSNAKYIDIRLHDDYIVFRGSEHEASSAHLKGSLILCLTEPIAVKRLRLTLTGMSRISWHLPPPGHTGSNRKGWRERSFFEKIWIFRDPGKGKTEVMKADNYEYPFDMILEGTLPESIEGLHDTWITYRFKAEIGRKYSKDIVFRKPLRIIRTLDPGNLELSHAMSVENIWTNKIEYSISTPTKAVVFGTSIRVDFRLVSLLKGLRIGIVTTQVQEYHDFTIEPENGSDFTNTYKNQRTIAEDEHVVDNGEDPEILNEEQEGYEFSRHIELPKTLRKCVQDVEERGIKIRHKLKFNVQLHNPDGHTSELRANLPVLLFISPNTAINEDNDLVDQTLVAGRDTTLLQLHSAAPPLYGEHQFDQLYSDVDPSGYRTPGPVLSSPETPLGPYSRSTSSENLLTMRNLDSIPSNEDISASSLANRLSNLESRRSPTTLVRDSETTEGGNETRFPDTRRPSDHTVGSSSTSLSDSRSDHNTSSNYASVNVSRRSSAANSSSQGHSTVTPHFTEFEDISRIPSYSTAVKTPVRTPCTDDLPSYGDATSRNNSISGMSGMFAPQSPDPAHLRPTSGSRSGGNLVSLARGILEELPRSHSHSGISNLHPDQNTGNRSHPGRLGL